MKMRHVPSLACLLLLLAHVVPISSFDPAVGIQRADKGLCPMSGLPPKQNPYAPKLCPQYTELSCCKPQQDGDYLGIFEGYLQLGQGCEQSALSLDKNYVPFRDYICAICDPNLGEYMYNDAGDVDNPFKFRICKSFVNEFWGDDGSKYDDCGLMTPSSCDITYGSDTLAGPGDPFDCGDDLVIPSVWFEKDPSQFMNGNADGLYIKPQEMDDLFFEIVDDIEDPERKCWKGGVTSSASALFPSLFAILLAALLAIFF